MNSWRNAQVETEIECNANSGAASSPLSLLNGALEHLRVMSKPTLRCGMLLPAEKISGAAEFEIERGNAETGAEFTEFFHRR